MSRYEADEIFEKCGDTFLRPDNWGSQKSFTVDDFYAAIKARLAQDFGLAEKHDR